MRKTSIVTLLLFMVLFAWAQKSKVEKAKPKKIIAAKVNAKESQLPKIDVKLNDSTYSFDGTLFNSVLYNFGSSKSRYDAYYNWDNTKKELQITEVEYEIAGSETTARVIKTYNCPMSRINKKDSYLLDMDSEDIEGGKYQRLTLLCSGQGVDNLYFTEHTKTGWDEPDRIKKVNNVTINIVNKEKAKLWLNEFIK